MTSPYLSRIFPFERKIDSIGKPDPMDGLLYASLIRSLKFMADMEQNAPPSGINDDRNTFLIFISRSKKREREMERWYIPPLKVSLVKSQD